MQPLRKGRFQGRLAQTPADIRAAQRLRWLCFIARNGHADDGTQIDSDAMDTRCHHVLIEETTTGQLVCTFRFLPLAGGHEIGQSYSAQHYDLSSLERFRGPIVEMGRFCIHPEWRDPSILRLAWAIMTRFVDDSGTQLLFGCSSFRGTRPDAHADAFAILKERHLAPRRWLPRVKAPDIFRFARGTARPQPDPRYAMAAMPPLLRSYLAMGGWVSDHAVVDQVLETMHVFTGVEIHTIPAARKRLLRADTI